MSEVAKLQNELKEARAEIAELQAALSELQGKAEQDAKRERQERLERLRLAPGGTPFGGRRQGVDGNDGQFGGLFQPEGPGSFGDERD